MNPATLGRRYAFAFAALLADGWPPVDAAELAALHLELNP